MGVKNRNEEQQYGTTLDTNMFKGNVDLQMHLHASIHSKSKKKWEKSKSLKNTKISKRIVFDDFNIKLPDDEIQQHGSMCDSKDAQKIKAELAKEAER